jgi:cob(I)alamin adenosyltransferase
MLRKLDKQTIAALATLQGHNDFQTFLKYLQQSLVELRKDNQIAKEDVIYRWQQGAIQTLDQLIETCETARETLRKFQ